MKKQNIMSQKKGQDKTPEKLNEVEIGNLPEKEFRIIIGRLSPSQSAGRGQGARDPAGQPLAMG